MDEEFKGHIDAMTAQLMAQMNDQHERIIDEITTLRADFQTPRDSYSRMPNSGIPCRPAPR